MKLKLSIASAALLFVALALGLAWKHVHATAENNAALTDLRIQRTALESDLHHLKDRPASIERSAGSPPEKPAPPTASSDTQTILAQLHLQEKDPKLQSLYLKSNRAKTRATYSPFYRQLDLKPDQISSFEEIAFQRDEKVNDLVAAARSLGLTIEDPAVRKLLTDAHTDYHSRMKDILGAPAYGQLQDYERTSWLRQIVSDIAATATLTGAPFSRTQSEQLIGIIANTSPAYVQGKSVETGTIDWEIVDAQAATILSKEQFKVFTQLEGPTNGRFLAKLHAAISAAKKTDAERAASAEKN